LTFETTLNALNSMLLKRIGVFKNRKSDFALDSWNEEILAMLLASTSWKLESFKL
jgi:hypothetical protein